MRATTLAPAIILAACAPCLAQNYEAGKQAQFSQGTSRLAKLGSVRLDDANAKFTGRHPTFVAPLGPYLLIAAEESKNVLFLDMRTNQLVKEQKLRDEFEPYRLTIERDGYALVTGWKFASVIDVSSLPKTIASSHNFSASDVSKDMPTAELCLFPCGGGATGGMAHGAVDYSVTSAAFDPVTKEILVGAIDRKKNEGSLLALQTFEAGVFKPGWRQVADDPNIGMTPTRRVPVKEPEGLIVLPNSNLIAAVDQEDSHVTLLERDSGNVIATIPTGIAGLKYPFDYIPHVGDSIDVVASPDEKRLFVSNARSNSIAIVDVAARQVIKLISIPVPEAGPYGLSISRDGNFLYVALWAANAAAVIDTRTFEVNSIVPTGKGPMGVAVNESGTVYVACSEGNSVTYFELGSQ